MNQFYQFFKIDISIHKLFLKMPDCQICAENDVINPWTFCNDGKNICKTCFVKCKTCPFCRCEHTHMLVNYVKDQHPILDGLMLIFALLSINGGWFIVVTIILILTTVVIKRVNSHYQI